MCLPKVPLVTNVTSTPTILQQIGSQIYKPEDNFRFYYNSLSFVVAQGISNNFQASNHGLTADWSQELKIGDLDALYRCMLSTSREIQGFPRPLWALATALAEIMAIRYGKDDRPQQKICF